MFSHEKMKESLEGEVVVEDASPAVVKQFLRFVYTDSLDDTRYWITFLRHLLLDAPLATFNKLC